MENSSNWTFRKVAGWIFAIILAIVIVFALVCLLIHIDNGIKEEEVQATPPLNSLNSPMVETNTVRDPFGKYAYRISKIKFSGHTYIIVEDYGTAMLHDPDCECNLKK